MSVYRPRRAAFTLVELLVVIGIIALLIGILLPTLSRARQSANSIVCLSNQRQLAMGTSFFINEHDMWLPKAWYNDTPNPASFFSVKWGFEDPYWGWDYVLSSAYLDDSRDTFHCPSDDSEIYRGKEWWSPLDIDDIPASYRFNIGNQPLPWEANKVTEYVDPTKAIIISDGDPAFFHHVSSSEGKVEWGSLAAIGPSDEAIANMAPFRHSEPGEALKSTNTPGVQKPVFKVNAAFIDGHGETVNWDETWQVVGETKTNKTGWFTGVPTMWRQVFYYAVDTYDNPNTTADDANARP